MRFAWAAPVIFLVFLAAVCPRATEANTLIFRVPYDPVPCTDGTPPEGDEAIMYSSNVDGSGDAGDYVTVDGSPSALTTFANCTGGTVNDLYVVVDTTVGTGYAVTLQGDDFDEFLSIGIPTGDDPPGTTLLFELVCDPTAGTCTGMAEGDVGASQVPEPTEPALLLLGIGSVLGLAGWKRWKTGSSSVGLSALAAS